MRHWSGNIHLKVPGDHLDYPAAKQHKGLYQGESSSPNLFMCTVEAHVWELWGKMAERDADGASPHEMVDWHD